MYDLEETIRNRRSTRLFLRDKPVSEGLGDRGPRARGQGEPRVPQLPDEFQHFRRDLGGLLYGTMGVPHRDAEARRVAVLRN